MNDYIELKLNEKEQIVLKSVLSKVVLDDMLEKTQPDYEEKISKDYNKFSNKHKEAVVCGKILDVINYLER